MEKEGDEDDWNRSIDFPLVRNRVLGHVFIFFIFNSNEFLYVNEDVWEVITPTSELNGQVWKKEGDGNTVQEEWECIPRTWSTLPKWYIHAGTS